MEPSRSRWNDTDRRIGSAAELEARTALSRSIRHRISRKLSRSVERATGPVPFDVATTASRPSVSVVVPTAGAGGDVGGVEGCYVEKLLESLVATLGAHDEVLVVTGPEAPPELAERIVLASGADPRVRRVQDPEPFSFSERVNLGVEHSTGEVVLLLNDDTEVLGPTWLDSMATVAVQPSVGAVGATLVYDDGSIQHAGLTTIGGLPTHAWPGWDPDDHVDGGVLQMDRRAWGVTGAALAVSRSNWDALGGFSPAFPVNYNDVDFCCKAAQMGLVNVVLGSVRLVHLETRTRPRQLGESEVRALRTRWAHRLGPDPLVFGTSALVDRRSDVVEHGGGGDG